MAALIPPCPRTRTMSTIRRRYLTSCPASRLLGLSRTSQRSSSAMTTCPEDPETRRLCCRSGTWPCVFRGREMPGGQAYYTFLKPASSHSTTYSVQEYVQSATSSCTTGSLMDLNKNEIFSTYIPKSYFPNIFGL